MFAFPELHPGVAEQVLRAAELEQLDASRIQIVDTAIEIEDLDAIIASLDEMTPELLERWKCHAHSLN